MTTFGYQIHDMQYERGRAKAEQDQEYKGPNTDETRGEKREGPEAGS